MNLAGINSVYLSLKQTLEQEDRNCNQNQKTINTLNDDITELRGQKVSIQRNQNLGEQDKREKIEEVDKKILQKTEEIRQIRRKLLERKQSIKQIKEEIDAKMAEIKENPEMRKHLNTVLKKRYERELPKVKKEKEKLIEEKDQVEKKQKKLIEKNDKVEKIKQLTTNHPTLANNLKGMISAYKTAESLTTELEELKSTTENGFEYTDPERAKKIINELLPAAEKKMKTNKDQFMKYINKNKLGITEQDVDELVKKGIINEKGEVDLEKTFVKTTKELNEQINGSKQSIIKLNRRIKELNESIEDYTFAIDGKGTIETAKPRRGQQKNRGQMNEEKPKWFQLIKRFRAWRDRRNQPELPEGGQETPSEEEKKTKSPVDEFADSLQYNIVKDVVEQTQKEELEEARKARIEKELQSKGEQGKDDHEEPEL